MRAATMDPIDFQVLDLNPGFSVAFFGIVEDNTDIVRLTIRGEPINVAATPEPGTFVLAVFGFLMLAMSRQS